jgi:putative acetyltransferase
MTTERPRIQVDDLSGAPTRALVRLHLESMRAATPVEFSFALDLSGLQAPDITLWSAWQGERIAGIAALKQHDHALGEVKSMRTHPDFLRHGIATMLLEHIIAVARARGLTQLSCETGTGPSFAAAVALYRKHGFVDGGPFADYAPSAHNQFLHLAL